MSQKRKVSPMGDQDEVNGNKRRNVIQSSEHPTGQEGARTAPDPVTTTGSTAPALQPQRKGPKSPNDSKFLAKLINKPRSSLSRATAVQAATAAAQADQQPDAATQLQPSAQTPPTNLTQTFHSTSIEMEGTKPGFNPEPDPPPVPPKDDTPSAVSAVLHPNATTNGTNTSTQSVFPSQQPEQETPADPPTPPEKDVRKPEPTAIDAQGAAQSANRHQLNSEHSISDAANDKVQVAQLDSSESRSSNDVPEPGRQPSSKQLVPEPPACDQPASAPALPEDAGSREDATQHPTAVSVLERQIEPTGEGQSAQEEADDALPSSGEPTQNSLDPFADDGTKLSAASWTRVLEASSHGPDEPALDGDVYDLDPSRVHDHSAVLSPVDDLDAEEIDQSLTTIEHPVEQAPETSYNRVSEGSVPEQSRESDQAGSAEPVQDDEHPHPSPSRFDQVPIDLTRASTSSDEGVPDESAPSLDGEGDISRNQTPDGPEEEKQDPWLMSRAMLRRPTAPQPLGYTLLDGPRRPSTNLAGPLARAVSRSSTPTQPAPRFGSALAQVSAIGAQKLRSLRRPTPNVFQLSQPRRLSSTSYVPSTSGSSLFGSFKGLTGRLKSKARLDHSRKTGRVINLLRRLQPSRDWASNVHNNSVEAILKGARVLRAIDETPQGTRQLNRQAIVTDDYYQRKAAEHFLQRQKDAVSAIGPSPAKAEVYAKLRSDRVARQKALRGILGRPPLPPHLLDEQEEAVQEALKQRDLVVSMPGARVEYHDLVKLKPRSWLNDESINFYAVLLNQRSQRAVTLRSNPSARSEGEAMVPNAYWNVHVFNSFFYEKISTVGHSGVARWTRKFDAFSKDKILFPVNLSNTHWVTGCIDLRRKRIEYCDSMHAPNPHFFKHVRTWLKTEHKAKRKTTLDLQGWTDYTTDYFPQQANGFDCGVFTISAIEQLSRRDPLDPYPSNSPMDWEQERMDKEVPFNFSGKNMPYLRRRYIYEIISKRLLDA